MTFYFDGSSLKEGTSLVAFESLSYNDKEIVSHADVNDSGQTVIITKPKLSTTATDALMVIRTLSARIMPPSPIPSIT